MKRSIVHRISRTVMILFGLYFLSTFGLIAQEETNTDFTPSGKIWGLIFGDVIYKAEGDTLSFGRSEFANLPKGAIGGKLRRIYFGYDYNLSNQWFVRILFESNSGVTTDKGNFTPLIKLGYLQYKLADKKFLHNAKINVGLIPTPVFAFPEKEWGYRSVEKEALDIRGFGNSVDQGISFESDFTEEGGTGFKVMVSNGVGNKPKQNKHLEYHLSLFANLFDSRLKLEGFASYKENDNSLSQTITRGFASYSVKKFRFGIEAAQIFLQDYGKPGVNLNARLIEPFLISTFASTNLDVTSKDKDVWIFLRYDYFNPDLNFNKDFSYSDISQYYEEHLFIAGFQIEVFHVMNNIVQIMPNIHINAYERKMSEVVKRKPDVVLRTTLYYNF